MPAKQLDAPYCEEMNRYGNLLATKRLRSGLNKWLRTLSIVALIGSQQAAAFHTSLPSTRTRAGTTLSMSLKPAAMPLMDSGKALARSGELLIDMTQTMSLYGGGLSAAGAQIRNAGDCLA